ncbi:MAG TPA: DUF4157 domain-containing protein [Bryobacteraceae bacterium]|jgi:hypothetical protein
MNALRVSRKNAANKQAAAQARSTAANGLRIGPADDAFEREADRLADEVTSGERKQPAWSLSRMSVGPPLQRKCACGGSGECDECKEKAMLQRKASGVAAPDRAPAIVDEVLRSPGKPLDEDTRQWMEPRFGYDFGRVRIHNDAQAAESAQSVSAVAYTVGHDIVFDSGRYAPGGMEGRRLLAHELAHVVQQSGGAPTNLQTVREPRVQRTCVSGVTCPPVAVELPAGWPWSEAAEICIRKSYTDNHAGHIVGNNNTWRFLNMPPGSSAKRDHDCFKNSLMAKSGMFLAQPDIIDFTSAEIYDVTTVSQIKSHSVRVDADTKQATALAATPGCGAGPPSMRKWSPGVWSPPLGCYWIGGDIYLRAENVGNGLLIYHVLKDAKKEVITITLMATLAALLKSGGKGGMSTAAAGAGGKAVAARALAYANLAAFAILLASGKAEAKAGPSSDMPIETLFKAMAQKGTPVPPELQESMKAYLDANPDLKKKIEDASLKGGDMSDAQKEVSQRALKIVSENPEEFSQEDLELMLAANEAGGSAMPAADLTAAKLRAALDAKKSGQTGSGSGSTGSGGSKETVWDKAKKGAEATDTPGGKQDTPGAKPGEGGAKPADQPAKPDGQPGAPAGKPNVWAGAAVEGDPKLASLSQETKKKLAAAAPNVRNLLAALTEGSAKSAALTDAVVNRYLAIVPSDLTPEQAGALISRLAEANNQSADQILDSLQKAVEELKKKGQKPAEAQPEQSQAISINNAPDAKDATVTGPELLKKLAQFAAKSNYSKVSAGQMVITWNKEENNKFSGSILAIAGKDVKAAAWVSADIVKREDGGKKLTVKITASTPLVSVEQKVIKPSASFVGQSFTFSLMGK